MITIFYSIGNAEPVEKHFDVDKDFEKFCNRMDKHYGYGGWEIHTQERL